MESRMITTFALGLRITTTSAFTALQCRKKPLCKGATPHRGNRDGIGRSGSSKQSLSIAETIDSRNVRTSQRANEPRKIIREPLGQGSLPVKQPCMPLRGQSESPSQGSPPACVHPAR